MKTPYQIALLVSTSLVVLSACSHQRVDPAPPVSTVVQPPPAVVAKPKPPVVIRPPKAAKVMPPPKRAQPYRDIVVAPQPLQPVPKPVVRPAPIIRPAPRATILPPAPVEVPPVKAKGTYRGAIAIDNTLRQQYQQ